MPEVSEAPVAESEGQAPPGGPSTHFQNLVKSMETTLANPPPDDDAPPATPPELKKAPEKSKEAPKEAPPKAAPKEEETITSPRAADWKKLKADRDDWQKRATEHETTSKKHQERITALETEYTEYKTKTAINPEEITALKKDRDDLATRLERHALAETPKFRDYYNAKFEAAIDRAVDAVGKERADQIKAVMEAPKSSWRKGMLNEILAGMETEVDKLNLIASVNEYDQARDERSKAIDNHKEHLREWKATEVKKGEEQKARDAANRKAILAETLKAAEKFEAFQTKDDPEHNLVVAKNKKLLEDFITGGQIPDAVLLMLPVLASEGERLQKAVPALNAKIAELEEALKKYQGAEPKLEGEGAPKSEGATPKGYVEQVVAAWPGMRDRLQR